MQANSETGVMVIALIALISSGIAVYVGLTTKNAFLRAEKKLLEFQVDLFDKLDNRYWRKEDHTAASIAAEKARVSQEALVEREEEHYRAYMGKELVGLQTQIFQSNENTTILIRGALDRLKEGEHKPSEHKP